MLIIGAVTLVPNLAAQTLGTSARMSGMANSSAALVNGVDAIGVNPALIRPEEGVTFSVGLLPFGSNLNTDFIDYDTYKNYFTGVNDARNRRVPRYLTTDDKNVILSKFQNQTGMMSHDIRYSLLSAVVAARFGTFGFAISDRTGSNVAIPKEMLEFMFFGNPPGRTFDFSSTHVSSSWTRQYAASFATRLYYTRRHFVSVGASVKYVHGFAYFGIERFNSGFTTDPDNFTVNGRADMLAMYAGSSDWISNNSVRYTMFPSPVGHGFGIDLGIHGEVNRNFSAGLSLLDLGSVTWDRGAKRISASEDFFIDDITTSDQVDEIKSRINGTEESIGSFSTPLPSTVIIAGVYSFPHFMRRDRYLHLAASYRQGLNEESGNTTKPRFGVGTEFQLLWNVAFRLGVNFGGITPMTFSGGVGFISDNFKLDVGTVDIAPAMTTSFTGVSFGVSTHFDI
jgi:hypothetical protein